MTAWKLQFSTITFFKKTSSFASNSNYETHLQNTSITGFAIHIKYRHYISDFCTAATSFRGCVPTRAISSAMPTRIYEEEKEEEKELQQKYFGICG